MRLCRRAYETEGLMSDLAEQTKPALSNRQKRILVKRIRAEQASAPRQLADTPRRNRERDEYVQPAPADGENVIHEPGKTGRPIASTSWLSRDQPSSTAPAAFRCIARVVISPPQSANCGAQPVAT